MLSNISFCLSLVLCSICSIAALPASAQGTPVQIDLAPPPDLTRLANLPRLDPKPVLPCLSGIINHYTPVLGFGCDSSSLQVGPVTGFAAGDKVLILQMQVPQVDLSNTGNFGALLNSTCIGNYEFNRVLSLSGGVVQLQFALTRPYDLSGKVQLVQVPEYDSVMVCGITCLPWNGSVGGVLALEVKGQLSLTGNIDVSGKGFRGGIVESNSVPWVFGEQQYFYSPQSTLAAQKGEGIVSIPVDFSFGRGRAGNGGGGGNAHNGGGGGGANAGAGGNGGLELADFPAPGTPNTDGIGGQAYFAMQTNKILLGGGAGAGHANDEVGSSGGSGGGIVFILANVLESNNFRVLANGTDVFGAPEHNDGQGGGGGGGTVVLKTGQINGLLNCELKGGRGGSNPYSLGFQLHGPGGGGGGGKLLLTQNSANVIASLQGGANGLSTQNIPHGAMPGEAGKMLTGFVLPEGTQAAHPVSNSMLLALQSPPCSGLSNGQIAVLQSTALAYRLNGGPWQSDSIFTNLPAGVYQIGLQFSGGCTLDTLAVLTVAPPVSDSLLSLSPAGCTAGGHIEVAAISGTAPFEFQLNGGPWQSSGLFADLMAGNYAITVRDSAGCIHSSNYSLGGTSPAEDSLLSIVAATCIAGGQITVTAISGTAPYTFQLNGGAWQSSGVFSDLPAGNQSITLLDGAGCTHTSDFTIDPPPPVLDSLLSIVAATCIAGGQISVAAVSGTAPYTFQLNGGAWQSSGVFSDLPVGNQTITMLDGAGCTHTSDFTIDPPPPALDSLLSIVAATCIAGGQISLTAVSGTAPYTFQLNGGAWQSSGIFSDLPAGNQSITLLDGAGCTHTSDFTIDPAPPALDSLLSIVAATCIAGGQISVTAVSGTAPYTFQLNGGAWQSSGVFSDLPVGNQSITLLDGAGCTHTSDFTIDPPPPALDSLLSIVAATCIAGGQISVAAVSGTAPYTFQLNGGAWQSSGVFSDLSVGNQSITLLDGAGCTHTSDFTIDSPPPVLDSLLSIVAATCIAGGQISVAAVSGTAPYTFQLNGGAWQSSGVFSDLPAGNQSITLLDGAGCTHTSDFTIDPPPPALDSLLSIVGATCIVGGQISVAAVSGTAPFDFQLNGGTWQSSGVFLDLLPGNYTILLRDGAGCLHSSNYTISAAPGAMDSLVAIVPATCIAGGQISVSAVSGTAPFDFQLNGGSWQPSGNFSDLPPGNYAITLRDAAGCIDTGNYLVAAPPPALDSLLSIVSATCIAGGQISVAAVSGTAPYDFQLGSGAWQTSGVFSNLPVGDYSITLRDGAGCLHTSHYTISPTPPVLDSLLSIVGETCIAGGQISVTAISGTAPYIFQLDGGALQTNGVFFDLPAGTYSLTLRDAAGCTHLSSYSIAAPPSVQLQLDSLGEVDCRHELGFVAVSALGGSGGYTFQLDNGQQLEADGYFQALIPGIYAVTVTDSLGCEASLTDLVIGDAIDSALTRETVIIYEGMSFQLPDGSRTARPGEYPFLYETKEGCDSLHLIELIVLKRHFYIPNAFWPYEDGPNRFFTVYADASLEVVERLAVYDRWGELVFSRENLLPNEETQGWDGSFRGRQVNPGVFVWTAALRFVDGLELQISGNVTVFR